MGREVRRVPPDWQHPTDESSGRHKPLYYGAGGRFERQASDWLKAANEWDAGTHPGRARHPELLFYQDYYGGPPEAEDYMLVGVSDEACTHYQLYENTSEGTPCGPPFLTLDEVAEHAAEHATTFASLKADKATWLKIVSGEPVMVEIAPGLVNIP
jgi:hypothetical protein